MDSNLEYAQNRLEEFISELIHDSVPSEEPDAVFMAGSPGAGKTEVALGLSENYDNHILIDADAFRIQFPGYDGSNSSQFQKVSAWLVDQSFKFVVDKGYSFILDATFAVLSAEKNIIRTLKNGYRVTLFYVYQEPQVAWNYTKERELVEGRVVPKDTFINAFFQARKNIEKVKERHPEVTLHIIIKDYQNNISEVHFDADNIQLVLTQKYTEQQLEELLND
ncbi:zeta toxin family protein [Granulicatella sp.]